MAVLASWTMLPLGQGMERLQDRGWRESICFLVDADEIGLVWISTGLRSWMAQWHLNIQACPV